MGDDVDGGKVLATGQRRRDLGRGRSVCVQHNRCDLRPQTREYGLPIRDRRIQEKDFGADANAGIQRESRRDRADVHAR